MKIKKRYYVACVLMCLLSLALCVLMFNFEMGLARYSKLNKVAETTWIETSASDLDTRLDTNMRVIQVKPIEEVEVDTFGYPGKQNVIVSSKFIAYKKEVYGSNTVINGKINKFNVKGASEYGYPKTGDKITVYFKPDAPTKVYVKTNITPYIIGIACIVAASAAVVILCRVINKSLKDNTFSDSPVTFMDIPMLVIVVGIILTFFAGMLIGNIQVDSSYTAISQGLAEQYANHELVF